MQPKMSKINAQVLSNMVAHNGLRIGDGGAFGKRQPNICTNAQ
jgi:hypothetical protein